MTSLAQKRAQKYFNKIISSLNHYTLWSRDDLNANKDGIIKMMVEKNLRPIKSKFYRLENERLLVRNQKKSWEFEKRGNQWCCKEKGEKAGFFCGICFIPFYHRCSTKFFTRSDFYVNGQDLENVGGDEERDDEEEDEENGPNPSDFRQHSSTPPPSSPASPSFNELFDEISTEFHQTFPPAQINNLHICVEHDEFNEAIAAAVPEYSSNRLSQTPRPTFFSINNLLSDTVEAPSETSSTSSFASQINRRSFEPEFYLQPSLLVSRFTAELLAPKNESIADEYDDRQTLNSSITSTLPDVENPGHSRLTNSFRSQRKRAATNESEEDECKIVEVVSPLFKKPHLEQTPFENFQFDIPSSKDLKALCAKLNIEYNTAAYKLWSKISINNLPSKTTQKDIQCHYFKTKNPFECFAFLLTGNNGDYSKIQNSVNEAFLKNLVSRHVSSAKIDKIIMSSEITSDHLNFMATWLPCKIGIYENGILKKFGNWSKQGKSDESLIFIFSKVKGLYSIVLNV